MGAPVADAMEDLRRADLDRYLSVLYAPEKARNALATIYLFNAEIATIRDKVREPLPGEIRIQWWRDALGGTAEGVAANPLAARLIEAIERHSLPVEAFDRYLEARIFDLYNDPMPSRIDLEGYCGDTASALIQLASLVLEPEAAVSFAEAAGHAGCAQQIEGLLRLMPLHVRRGQCFLPRDILAAAGTSPEALVAGDDREAASRAVSAMVALGREHVALFERAARGMPAVLRPAFLPAALAGPRLERIGRAGGKALESVIDIGILGKHWTMLRRAVLGW